MALHIAEQRGREQAQAEPWCQQNGVQAKDGACSVHGGDACLVMAHELSRLLATQDEKIGTLEHERSLLAACLDATYPAPPYPADESLPVVAARALTTRDEAGRRLVAALGVVSAWLGERSNAERVGKDLRVNAEMVLHQDTVLPTLAAVPPAWREKGSE